MPLKCEDQIIADSLGKKLSYTNIIPGESSRPLSLIPTIGATGIIIKSNRANSLRRGVQVLTDTYRRLGTLLLPRVITRFLVQVCTNYSYTDYARRGIETIQDTCLSDHTNIVPK